jgi:glycosyltransferase involved in cell wall biosynthesis
MSAITAVIPLYNKAAHVRAALESVAGQTLSAARIIVVDDGSTDGGDRIVEAMALPNLRLIRQINAGPGAARNAGIAAAASSHVAFLDADDIWRPAHLERLEALQTAFPGLPLHANRIAALGASFAAREPADSVVADYASAWLDGLIVSTIGAMVDRDAALAVGGFGTEANRGEDLALWLKLTRARPMAIGGYAGGLYRTDASELTRRPVDGPDAAMRWIDAHLAGDIAADERATLLAYRERLALLHAAEWIRAGGRGEARSFLAMPGGSARNAGLRRNLGLLAGPLWPVRKAVIALRRML